MAVFIHLGGMEVGITHGIIRLDLVLHTLEADIGVMDIGVMVIGVAGMVLADAIVTLEDKTLPDA